MFLMTSKRYDRSRNSNMRDLIEIHSTNPKEWNSTGLSYNAPSAYACTELFALGLNHVSGYNVL